MDRTRFTQPGWLACRAGLPGRLARLFVVLLLAGSCTGCKLLLGVIMLIDGPPREDADFKRYTHRDMTAKGQKVIVLCSAPESARAGNSAIEVDLITEVSRRMQAHGIEVVDPGQVATWMDDNGSDFSEADMIEIGRKFNAHYVVHIDVDDFAYRPENSPGLYQGRAEGNVSVVALPDEKTQKDKPVGMRPWKLIYNKPFSSSYPMHQPVSADQISEPVFRKKFLDRVAEELARLFYDHRPGEEF